MSATDVVCSMLTVLFAAAAVHEMLHRVLPRNSGWRRPLWAEGLSRVT
ncbi:hypothetical protein ABT009_36045 [Streptomyces sp. NPDC002896]